MEMACKHCGKQGMSIITMDRLELLRKRFGRKMPVTSGHRCEDHPEESKKGGKRLGSHVLGMASDVRLSKPAQRVFIPLAKEVGFTGIGVADTYIHIDDVQPGEIDGIRRPTTWNYK